MSDPADIHLSPHITENEKSWATVIHLSAFAIFVVPFIGGILAPLIIWLIKRNDSPFLDVQGKEAINFNISVVLYGLVSAALMALVVGFFMLAAVVVFWFLFVIVAANKAYRGVLYKYPFSLRLVK